MPSPRCDTAAAAGHGTSVREPSRGKRPGSGTLRAPARKGASWDVRRQRRGNRIAGIPALTQHGSAAWGRAGDGSCRRGRVSPVGWHGTVLRGTAGTSLSRGEELAWARRPARPAQPPHEGQAWEGHQRAGWQRGQPPVSPGWCWSLFQHPCPSWLYIGTAGAAARFERPGAKGAGLSLRCLQQKGRGQGGPPGTSCGLTSPRACGSAREAPQQGSSPGLIANSCRSRPPRGPCGLPPAASPQRGGGTGDAAGAGGTAGSPKPGSQPAHRWLPALDLMLSIRPVPGTAAPKQVGHHSPGGCGLGRA